MITGLPLFTKTEGVQNFGHVIFLPLPRKQMTPAAHCTNKDTTVRVHFPMPSSKKSLQITGTSYLTRNVKQTINQCFYYVKNQFELT